MYSHKYGYIYINYENYVYNFDKRYENKNPKRFTCNAKSTKYQCPVTAWCSNDGTVRVEGTHYHPLPTGHHRAPAIAEIKGQANGTDASPNEIVNNVFMGHRDIALYMRIETARNHVHRERRRYRPPLPQSFDQLDLVLSNYRQVQNIYQGFVTGADGSIAYIFGSNVMINNLVHASEIHIDGTFQSIPDRPRAEQLIIILMRHIGIGIPVLFALTNHRTQVIYTEIWRWLLRKLPGLTTNLKYVISDYEAALMSSVRAAMPWIEHRGCWFHFARAVTRKWTQLQLPRNGENCYLLHLAWVLPLLPAIFFEDAIDYMDNLSTDLQNENQKYTDFLLYLHTYWEPKAHVVSVLTQLGELIMLRKVLTVI
ncbi:uncharacterized protein [Chelonus insularis]|uniref:uncharacterized protein n=1 Tax=Chelonus insularis TaxID=460826 RepID=UPI0015882CDE|nr:uncharacterized protein LOC118074753 [Chelonus insularis]